MEPITFFHPCHPVILRILLFISFRSAQHASVNPMAKSCIDFLSLIFWNKNMIMITVQTEINALQEMKGLRFNS